MFKIISIKVCRSYRNGSVFFVSSNTQNIRKRWKWCAKREREEKKRCSIIQTINAIFFFMLIFHNVFLFCIHLLFSSCEGQCTFIVHFNHLVSFLHFIFSWISTCSLQSIKSSEFNSQDYSMFRLFRLFCWFCLFSSCFYRAAVFCILFLFLFSSSSINYCAIFKIEKKLSANVLLIVRCYYLLPLWFI